MTANRERLVAVLSPVVSNAGFDLEDLELAGAGRRTVLRVVVDRDGGFGLDDVADLSRDVSAVLDADDDLLPGAYVLEVSSPGVDRPLTLPRHWRRNADRLVAVQLVEGPPVRGRIRSAGEQSVVLDVDGAAQEVDYDRITRATVQVELRRPAGVAPAKTAAAADDLDELDDLDDADDLDDLDGVADPDDVADAGAGAATDSDAPVAGTHPGETGPDVATTTSAPRTTNEA